MTTWKVYDKQMNELPDRGDWKASDAPSRGKKEKPPAATCWPNGKEAEFGLERCLRLYPHLQDTGGFFVAVLQKAERKPQEAAPSKSEVADVTDEVTKVAEAVASEAGTSALSEESSRKRAASPGAEKVESKRIKQDSTDQAVETPIAAGADEDVVREGGGRPFNEEPYTFLSQEDEQVKICRWAHCSL